MRKLHELGARTGLKAAQVNRIAKAGVLGLLAVGLTALAACFRAQRPPLPAPQARPQTLQDLVNSVEKSTAPALPADKACGPYPGYPCGTRYYTVSAADFRGRA